jgi:probable phosphoglycerate mutase
VSSPALPDLPTSRLVIWRHGRTEWNAAGRFQGQLDPPLDDVGREQAVRAAPHLVALGLSAQDTVVVSSDLTRAADTATALTTLLGVRPRLDPRLREHGLGSWEGLTREEVATRYPDQYEDWLAGRPVHGRGDEDAADVARRALEALADLPRASVAVVVTHGGTAGRLLESLLELGPQHRRVFGPLANCAWSELVCQGVRWRVVRHNTAAPQVLQAPADGMRASVPGLRAVPRALDGAASPEEGAPARGEDADAVL